jgi:hypothetical protein
MTKTAIETRTIYLAGSGDRREDYKWPHAAYVMRSSKPGQETEEKQRLAAKRAATYLH